MLAQEWDQRKLRDEQIEEALCPNNCVFDAVASLFKLLWNLIEGEESDRYWYCCGSFEPLALMRGGGGGVDSALDIINGQNMR